MAEVEKPKPGTLENVEAEQDGDILTLRIDLSQRLRRTKDGKGKSVIIGTTNGFHSLESGEWVSLMVGIKE
jgi:hypothetical protein